MMHARKPDKSPTFVGFGKTIEFDRGEIIFHENDPGDEMYVILSGRVRLFLSTEKGELTLTKLRKGDFFGEMALLEELPRTATAQALNRVILIGLNKEDFMFLIREHPEIAMKVLAKFSARLRDADHLINLLLLGDTIGLVLNHLVKLALLKYENEKKMPPEWHLNVKMETLAEEIKLDQEQLLRIMSELERLHIVSLEENKLIVYQHKKLKYYLEYLNWRA